MTRMIKDALAGLSLDTVEVELTASEGKVLTLWNVATIRRSGEYPFA